MTIILGIDPGGTTGLASISVEGRKIKLIGTRSSRDPTCLDFLDLIEEADVIVCENFLNRPGMTRSGSFDWSSNLTSQVIGSLKTLAALQKKEFVLQEPAIKPVGYGFANLKYQAGKKGTHQKDALAHAVYYAVARLHALPVSNDSQHK